MVRPVPEFSYCYCVNLEKVATAHLEGRPAMPKARREAEVLWEGPLARGTGTLKGGSGALYKTLHDARRKLRARLAQDGLAIEGQAA